MTDGPALDAVAPLAAEGFPAIRAAFGSPNAQPRILRAWHPEFGMQRVRARPRMTVTEAERLRHSGFSLVVLAWHGRRKTMALVRGSARSIWRGLD